MKKILILLPNNIIGSAADERVKSFGNFFSNVGLSVEFIDYPNNILNLLKLVFIIYLRKIDYIFISQPPFKYMIIFLLPFLKKIIDFRDGWSIAIQDGYGGLVKPNLLKAKIARKIEKFCIDRSVLSITCTPGLKKYLSKISSKEILLIPNGISRENFEYINSNLVNKEIEIHRSSLKFYCAGKFSEYGVEKVKKILNLISTRYANFDIELNLIGCNKSNNEWIEDYIPSNWEFKIHDKMVKKDLYIELNKADIFLVVIRDSEYELGTKIYEYLVYNKKVFNYFEVENNFTNYFDGGFDVNFCQDSKFDKEIIRENLINIKKFDILNRMGIYK